MKSKRRLLGQHLLVSESVAENLISAAELRSRDTVLEIGTGDGFITRMLSPLVRQILTFEVDPTLLQTIEVRGLERLGNVVLSMRDPLKNGPSIPSFDVCVTSLPYSRSRDFIEWLSKQPHRFRTAAAIVQEEFAQKLIAKAGDDDYRAISIIAQICFEVELKQSVNRSAFRPQPKVASRIITLIPKFPVSPMLDDSKIKLLHYMFSRRRKLANSVLRKIAPGKSEDLNGVFLGKRVEELKPEEFEKILEQI